MFPRLMLRLPLLFVALSGLFTGCTLVGLPDKEEYARIQAGERALALLRITAELPDGTPIGAFSNRFVRIFIGGFETGGQMKSLAIAGLRPIDARNDLYQFLSEESRNEGWIYFILEPGTNYLSVIGQAQVNDLFEEFPGRMATWVQWIQKSLLRWRIDIPPASPLVYVGTLHLRCRSKWYLFEGKACDYIEGMDLENQGVLAEKLARQYLPNLGPPQTILMQRHERGTIILQTPGRKRSK